MLPNELVTAWSMAMGETVAHHLGPSWVEA